MKIPIVLKSLEPDPKNMVSLQFLSSNFNSFPLRAEKSISLIIIFPSLFRTFRWVNRYETCVPNDREETGGKPLNRTEKAILIISNENEVKIVSLELVRPHRAGARESID